MSHPCLNVTLTGTSNPYLEPRLPLRGEIELFEIGRDGTLISAVFRVLGEDGRVGVPVEVKSPTFTYDPATDRDMFRARNNG